MRLPWLIKYGLREELIVILTGVILGIGSGLLWPNAMPWPQIGFSALSVLILAFFRDPCRTVPQEPGILLAPADGHITDVTELTETEYIKGPALRIGIFLSVFDVHINRTPCQGKVEYIQHRPGKFLNAMRSEDASAENESNSLGLGCPNHPVKKCLVKQITGAIARRIVCGCQIGETLPVGHRYGMIKFGSRTELFIPRNNAAQVLVKKGDRVFAGLSIMVRYGRH